MLILMFVAYITARGELGIWIQLFFYREPETATAPPGQSVPGAGSGVGASDVQTQQFLKQGGGESDTGPLSGATNFLNPLLKFFGAGAFGAK